MAKQDYLAIVVVQFRDGVIELPLKLALYGGAGGGEFAIKQLSG
jgi:hypothetical protein